MSTSRSARTRTVLCVAGCGLAVLTAEATLQVTGLPAETLAGFLGPDRDRAREFVPDRQLFWKLRPDSPDYAVNREGLRGPWPARRKRSNDLRVVCVGDSCTFGSSVRLEETWGMRLERRLQDAQPHRVVETTLLALPGYSTYQSRLLFERHVDFLEPDVTILYCGAWNDFVPAIGQHDAARAAATVDPSPSRIVRLVASMFGDPGSADTDRYRRAFAVGEAPDGRRVPLSEFRQNLARIVDAARTAGSEVVVILPPSPPRTRERYPVAETYRDALRGFAAARTLPVLDGQALFDAFVAELPADWAVQGEHGDPICYQDWIHPSPLGHELLARALFDLLRTQHEAWRGGSPTTAAEPPTLGPPTPGRIRCGELAVVEVPLGGRASTIERVWIGNRWLRDYEVETTRDTLRLRVPSDLVPGSFRVRAEAPGGIASSTAELVVEPPDIRAAVSVVGDELVLTADIEGPPGAIAAVWLSPELRAHPAATRYGPFHLLAEVDGRPENRPDLPFRFDLLKLPGYTGRIGAAGVLHLSERLHVERRTVPATIWLQGGYIAEHRNEGRLTRAIALDVPR